MKTHVSYLNEGRGKIEGKTKNVEKLRRVCPIMSRGGVSAEKCPNPSASAGSWPVACAPGSDYPFRCAPSEPQAPARGLGPSLALRVRITPFAARPPNPKRQCGVNQSVERERHDSCGGFGWNPLSPPLARGEAIRSLPLAALMTGRFRSRFCQRILFLRGSLRSARRDVGFGVADVDRLIVVVG